jgi:hypothetical protein
MAVYFAHRLERFIDGEEEYAARVQRLERNDEIEARTRVHPTEELLFFAI